MKKISLQEQIKALNPDNLLKSIKKLNTCDLELKIAGELILKMLNRYQVLTQMRISVPMHYAIYIPSKLNSVRCILPRLLNRYEIPFKLVIEPQDQIMYANKWGKDSLLILPENNMGLSYSRNFIISYSKNLGEKKHWQLDDDIGGFAIVDENGISTAVNPTRALNSIEIECDKYSNIGMAGPSNQCFPKQNGIKIAEHNKLVASCLLIDNTCKYVNFEIDCVEDIDCCLTILFSQHWCTLKFINVLMGKSNDLQVSGNYNGMEKYKDAVKKITKKWSRIFSITKLGRLRIRIWSEFAQTPLKLGEIRTYKGLKRNKNE